MSATGTETTPLNPTPTGRHRVALDAALLCAYLLGAAFLIALSLEPPHATPLPGMLAVALASAAALSLRHRWPTAAFATATLLVPLGALIGTGWEAAILLVFVTETALRQPARRAWATFAGALAAALVAAALLAWRQSFGYALLSRTPAPAEDMPAAAFSFALILGIPLIFALLFALNIAHRRRLIESLVAQAEQARREQQQRTDLARAEERESISREMHDVIAHSLAVMIALADGAESVVRSDSAEAERAVQRIGKTGRRALGEVRRLLGSTRDEGELAYARPGVEELATLVKEFCAAGLPVTLSLDISSDVDDALGFTVYRIVQESLTNTLRHARDTQNVTVSVRNTSSALRVEVIDISAAATTTAPPGRGLVGIRERAALYDGTVEVGPRAAGGWRVEVVLPTEEL